MCLSITTQGMKETVTKAECAAVKKELYTKGKEGQEKG